MARVAGIKAGDVICFGHTHRPWHREIDGITFVNSGSVGRPKDGDWRAGYVMLDIDAGSGNRAPDVELRRVQYDIDRAVDGIRASELPDELAEHLRTGGAT